MKYIEIPADVTLVDPDNDQVPGVLCTFVEFFKKTILRDEVFGSGVGAINAADNMESKLDEAVAKGVGHFEVHEADYPYLERAITAPSPRWRPIVMRQLRTFIKAIQGAKDQKPAAPSAPAESPAG